MPSMIFFSNEATPRVQTMPTDLRLLPVERGLFSPQDMPTTSHNPLIGPGDRCSIYRKNLHCDEDRQNNAELAMFGLIPSWACDTRSAMQNCVVHVADVANKPSYRTALFNAQFCWISVCYFLGSVWKDGREQPVRIERADHQPLLLVGIWSEWVLNNATTLLSFCLLTRDSDSQLKAYGVRIGQGKSQCFAFLSSSGLLNCLDQPYQQAIDTLANTNLPALRVTPHIPAHRPSNVT